MMKDVLDIIQVCRAKGVELSVEGDGSRLRISGSTSKLTAADKAELQRLKQELISFLGRAEEMVYTRISAAPIMDSYPLSAAQKRLWILHQLDERNGAYNEATVNVFEGKLDKAILEASFLQLIQRHEILRTRFIITENGEPRQYIDAAGEARFTIPVFNCTAEQCDAATVNHLLQQFIAEPFNLQERPLLRAALFQTATDRWVFCFVLHHIISDGWSLDILIRELLAAYRGLAAGEQTPLPPLAIQYKDYTAWQQQQLEEGAFAAHKTYWLQQFADGIPVLELPTSQPRPAVKTYEGAVVKRIIPAPVVVALQNLCRQQDATLFMGLLAGLNVLLYRYSGQDDIVTGTPVAGRDHPDLEGQVGFYVNTLALRTRFTGSNNFTQLLQQARNTALNGLAHQSCPFDEVVEGLAIAPDLGRNPLFDVMLILQNTGFVYNKDAQYLDGVAIQLYQQDYQRFSKFDLVFECTEKEEGLELKLAYNTTLFTAAMAAQLCLHLERLLQLAVAQPGTAIEELDYLGTEEKQQLLGGFNNTVATYPTHKGVTTLFREQAALHPGDIALVFEQATVSYAQLDSRALQFAAFLRSTYQLEPGSLVAICLPRSEWLVTALLGTLYAGAAYVPVDPEYPQERIDFMVADSGCQLLVDQAVMDRFTTTAEVQQPDTIEPATPHKWVALIYTTGSTGIPKGIALTEANLLNRLYWMWEAYPFKEGEVCAAKTSTSFVDHLWEIFGPLLKGIPLVIFSKETVLQTELFIEQLSQHRVSRLVLVPSLLREMLHYDTLCAEKLGPLEEWTCSGEALDPVLADRFYEVFKNTRHRLLNIYGSTEVTADATYFDTSIARKAAAIPRAIPYLFSPAISEELDRQLENFVHPGTIIGGIDAFKRSPGLQEYHLQQQPVAQYSDFIRNMLLNGVVDVSHPRFIGHMTGPVPPVLEKLNELMIPLNQNLVKFETSGVGTLMERQCMGMLHHLVYGREDSFYEHCMQDPSVSLGVITSGGTLSNITALSYELSRKLGPRNSFEGINKKGLVAALQEYGYTNIKVVGSERCHYSIGKALKVLGLGSDNFLQFNISKKNLAADKARLREILQAEQEAGVLLMAIIGVGGSTESGNVDPLRDMAELAREFGIHFHVDAAFGGGYLFSGELAHKLDGIALSDSVTICGHKQLYLPLGLSVCLFRNELQARSSENNTRYQARRGSLDIGRYTIEGSRPFLSMVLHGALRMVGKQGYGEMVESNYHRTQLFKQLLLARPAFQVLEEPEMNILLYRFIPASLRGIRSLRPFTAEETSLLNSLNIELQKRQFEKGISFVSYTEIRDLDNPELTVVWFRTVLMNPYTTQQHLTDILDEQEAIAAEMLGVRTEKEEATSSAYQVYVGRPIANTRVYILNSRLQLSPVMVAGEICIGGDSLTEGYVNRPELMAERFIDNPFNPGERLYRTGDLGRWLPDGNIEYLGRMDDQVKIRGHRVETGEVATALKRHAQVNAAVVTAVTYDGITELAAYITADAPLQAAELRSWLEKILPLYMIPAWFVQLETLPLTTNGKVNKKALPDARQYALQSGNEYIAPRNETEAQLAQLWKELLGVQTPIGIKDHFFQLGGHSLKATRLLSMIHRNFGVKLQLKELFATPVLENQAKLVTAATHTGYELIPTVAPSADGYVLSSSQQRLWVLGQLDDGNSAYNITGAVLFTGPLNREALALALNDLIDRHEILRTVFKETAPGEVRQFIQPAGSQTATLNFHVITDSTDPHAAVSKMLETDFNQPFHFETGPLFRASLYQLPGEEWVFSYVLHHIAGDGWSLEIINQELLQYYTARVQEVEAALPALRIQYKDYAAWQQAQLSAPAMQQRRDYWLQQFAGAAPVPELPLDKPRPANMTFNGDTIYRLLPTALTGQLEAFCQENGATLFMGLVATLNAFLYRYTGREDIVLGVSVAGREHPELEDQVGLYANTLALRTSFTGEGHFQQLLETVKQVTLGAFEHQAYPFDELVNELPLRTERNRNPLFDIMVAMQNAELSREDWRKHLSGLEVNDYEAAKNRSMFDLSFSFMETSGGLQLAVEYNTNLFTQETINGWALHLEKMLAALVRQPLVPLNRISLVDDQDQQQILQQFNALTRAYDLDVTVVDLFLQQAAVNPDTVALVYKGQSITYAQLEQSSAAVAAYLQSAGAGRVVGVMMDRSDTLVTAVLGILRSGAGYVPIDKDYPADRVYEMAASSGCQLIITDEVMDLPLPDSCRFVQLDELVAAGGMFNGSLATADDLAYVIYSSGTTGKPKGIMIGHAAIMNLLYWYNERYELNRDSRIVQLTNIVIDIAFQEIFSALINGSTLYIPTKEESDDRDAFVKYLDDNRISFIQLIPDMLAEYLLEGPRLQHLSMVLVGGDKLTDNLKDAITAKGYRLYNVYGQTETAIDTVGALCVRGEPMCFDDYVPNYDVYIIDEYGNLCPDHIAGEIYTGGVGLAMGYINQPELTAEKFIAHPFKTGELIYRTGDMAKRLPDGSLLLLGRKDNQVKIRGYRVELGEIEAALEQHPLIATAVVTVLEADGVGDKELAAYLVGKEGAVVSGNEVRSFLAKRKPAYMVPAYYIVLDKLPLSAAGKVDRKQLPAPSGSALGRGAADYTAPRTATEIALANIWKDLLGVERVGVEDDFFELGGHSLKATRLSSQVHKHFGVKLALKEIFAHPQLQEQAKLIDNAAVSGFENIPIAPAQVNYPLSSSQKRLWVLDQSAKDSVAYNMTAVYVFEGQLNREALAYSFDQLINRHESLRTIFREDETGMGRQFILPPGTTGFQVQYKDLRQEARPRDKVRVLVQVEFVQPFNLATGPLLRATVYQTAEQEWIFCYSLHHIISDDWSMGVMLKELLYHYHSYLTGAQQQPEPLRIQYKDYASWQQAQLASPAADTHRAYWLQQFSDEVPVLQLKGDKNRPAIKNYSGRLVGHSLPAETSRRLSQFCREQGGTLFMGVLAAVNLLLYKYTGQHDIVVGSPVAGREHADLDNQIGFYLNTLALRTRFNGTDNFKQLFAAVKESTLGAYMHQALPFDELLETLDYKRDLGRTPLFDVLVVLQNTGVDEEVKTEAGGLVVSPYKEAESLVSNFDLTFDFMESEGQLHMRIEYSTALFTQATVQLICSHLEQLIGLIVENTDVPVDQLPFNGQLAADTPANAVNNKNMKLTDDLML